MSKITSNGLANPPFGGVRLNQLCAMQATLAPLGWNEPCAYGSGLLGLGLLSPKIPDRAPQLGAKSLDKLYAFIVNYLLNHTKHTKHTMKYTMHTITYIPYIPFSIPTECKNNRETQAKALSSLLPIREKKIGFVKYERSEDRHRFPEFYKKKNDDGVIYHLSHYKKDLSIQLRQGNSESLTTKKTEL